MEIRQKIGKNNEDVDPFQSLGHGIQSYFKMIETMIYLFTVFTILFIPVFYLYNNGRAFNEKDSFDYGTYSLGNLGHTEPICKHEYFEKKDGITRFRCKKGKLSKLHAIGVIPEYFDGK